MEEGALDGRLITEGTLTRSGVIAPVESADAITQREGDDAPEVSAASLALPRPAAGRGPRLWLALGAVGVAVAVALVAVAGVAGGWALGWFDAASPAPAVLEVGSPEAAPAEAGAAAGEGAAEPVGEEAPGAEPTSEPTALPSGPTATAGRPAPPPPTGEGAETAVAPIAEPPVSAPPPEPAPVAIRRSTGHVALEGSVAAQLISEEERYALPADVPPGTYRIEAMFNGRDYDNGGEITVEADGTHTVLCRARMMRCTVK